MSAAMAALSAGPGLLGTGTKTSPSTFTSRFARFTLCVLGSSTLPRLSWPCATPGPGPPPWAPPDVCMCLYARLPMQGHNMFFNHAGLYTSTGEWDEYGGECRPSPA